MIALTREEELSGCSLLSEEFLAPLIARMRVVTATLCHYVMDG